MSVELQINNSASPAARILTWAPSACRIRMTNLAGVTGSAVNMRITGAAGGVALYAALHLAVEQRFGAPRQLGGKKVAVVGAVLG